MAVRNWTGNGANDYWTTAGNWDTLPVNTDSAVINGAYNVIFDEDMSGWSIGLGGLTIDGGAMFGFKDSADSYLKMDASILVGATSQSMIRIGISGLPFVGTATIEFNTQYHSDGDLQILLSNDS